MDIVKNPSGICNCFPSYFKNLQIKSQMNILDVEQQKATGHVFKKKVFHGDSVSCQKFMVLW